MRMRRILLTTTATMTIGVLGAGPALAHYCYRTGWNEASLANAVKGEAWVTAAELAEFVPMFIPCTDGQAVVLAALEAAPDDALFMGPGLLAGGTSPHGPASEKAQTPDQFDYLIEAIEDAFGVCGAPADAH